MSTPRRPPMTALDADSMQAAVRASFRGLYGREPSGLPGSGADDVGYWIRVADHFGAFSDGVERAGWSRYWELKLSGAESVDPRLGDIPARFQPTMLVPPEATPPPVDPSPPINAALNAILSRLDKIDADLQQLQAEHIALSQQVYRATLWGYQLTLRPGPP